MFYAQDMKKSHNKAKSCSTKRNRNIKNKQKPNLTPQNQTKNQCGGG